MNNAENPFSQIMVEKQPNLFFGQERLIVAILQGICLQEPRSYAIEGLKTFGKTTLFYFLKHPQGARQRYSEALTNFNKSENQQLCFFYVDFYHVPGEEMLDRLYQQAITDPGIRDRADKVIKQYPSNNGGVKEQLLVLLDGLAEQGLRLVVLMDHFDKTFESMSYPTDVFVRSLTHNHAFIIATEKNLSQLRRDATRVTSPLIGILLPRQIGVLTENEARQMITQPMRFQDRFQFSEKEIEYVLQASGMQPFLIAAICEFLYDLHRQYPNVSDLMAGSEFAEQVGNWLLAIPTVVEVFTLFWHDLDLTEQHALSIIASGKDASAIEPRVISKLSQRGLIKPDIPSRTSQIYAGLFRLYIQQQTPQPDRRNIDQIGNALSAIDSKLYHYLVENPDRLLPFEELLIAVWGDSNASKKGLEAAIHRLRTRIKDVEGQDQDYIQNVRKKGFVYHINKG